MIREVPDNGVIPALEESIVRSVPDLVCVIGVDAVVPDKLRLFAALGPDTDLHEPLGIEKLAHACHDTGVTVFRPFVLLSEVGMCVELEHGEVGVARGIGCDRRRGDGVFAAERHDELPEGEQVSDRPVEELKDGFGLLPGDFEGRERAYAVLSTDLPLGLFVEKFDEV